eukprot:253419-Chlamydomonas_euryale.AAC.3
MSSLPPQRSRTGGPCSIWIMHETLTLPQRSSTVEACDLDCDVYVDLFLWQSTPCRLHACAGFGSSALVSTAFLNEVVVTALELGALTAVEEHF